MELHSKGSQFQWISGKNPPDLLVFWQWFSPPNGSWRQETIGGYATQKKIFRNLCILKKFWRFLKNSQLFLLFSGYQMELHSKGSQFSIFLIPGSDFRLPGVRFSNGITTRSAFFQNRINFLKIWWRVMISDDELWWVMMSDDEWWGVMMRDNELWWVMISDGK